MTKWKKPRVARGDIPVWKILLGSPENHAPFTRYVYSKGLNFPESGCLGAPSAEPDKRGNYRIDEGWLHAIRGVVPRSAVDFACRQMMDRGVPAVARRMVIPKGTEYYEDCSSWDVCAKCLRWD